MGIYSMLSFFQKGGAFMYPILLVFLTGMAIAVERWFQLSRVRSVTSKLWCMLYPMLAKGEFDKVRAVATKDKSTIARMLGMGLANFPLSMLSAFSDVISYVRLMAVGLASSVLASSFNELAFSAGSWFIAIPVLALGHSLNMGLALIALFAHGVRLNMLEFSNNLGLQWSGYEYKPFSKNNLTEN